MAMAWVTACMGLPILAQATEFAQEPFLVPHSVAANGSALLIIPQAMSPMNFLDWPAGTPAEGMASLEASSQPLLGGLSQAILGAAHYQLDANTRIFAMTGIIGTDQIPVRPLLQGTTEERLNQPDLRPGLCESCGMLTDKLYLGALNAQRTFHGQLPRNGIASQPIPLDLGLGVTSKYYWEELEGDGYIARALNLDAALSLTIGLDYDPVLQKSQRDLVLHFSGFELLPTSQRSEIAGFVKEEQVEPRWHVGLQWREEWTTLKSTTTLGLMQRSESGQWPGIAGEWNWRDAVYFRLGYDGLTWASGASLKWHVLTLHYALQNHPLGTNWYQVSLQAAWPAM
jgi:hypothetical protein